MWDDHVAVMEGDDDVFVLGIDCNGNGVSDACDIVSGASTDLNGNNVLDKCECLWDLDAWGPCD